MDSNRLFDCIVVGAGIEGSSSAYQLAKKSCNTLLLEQFYLPHSRGSSHGPTRIIRNAHKNLVLTKMMKEAFAMWHELEIEANTKLYRKTGMLLIDYDTPSLGNNHWDNKVFSDIPHEYLTSRQLNQRYTGINYNDNYKAILEIPAGTLLADRALRCYQDLFVKYGGNLHDGEEVLQIIPGTMVTVKTTKKTYSTKNLVLTPGPWASRLLQQIELQLPLKVERINVCYYREKVPGLYSKFPALANLTYNSDNAHGVFSLPIAEYPGLMKICLHHGDRQAISNPDNRDMEKNNEDIHILSKFLKEHFPGLEDSPAIVEECLYTIKIRSTPYRHSMISITPVTGCEHVKFNNPNYSRTPCLYVSTPDYTPIIDKHPMFPNIAFACGMSGVGFKFAPVFGKIIAEFVLGKETDYDLRLFCHDRFNQRETVKSKL